MGSLEKQTSHTTCKYGENFGCTNGTSKMWTDAGCRGVFTCNGNSVSCDHNGGSYFECECGDTEGEVWVRKLTDGDFAVALPNWADTETNLTFCLDSLKWPHGETAHARNVWAKKDLGTFSQQFTATVASHDSLLLRISPDKTVAV